MSRNIAFELPFPGRVSPDIKRAQEQSVSWARRHLLIVDEAGEERVRDWDIAGLMARWVPDAVGADLDLAVDTVLVATVLNDEFDSPLGWRSREVDRFCDELAAVIAPEEPAEPRTPFRRALAEVWGRLTQGASDDWLARHRHHWGWNLEASVVETDTLARHVGPAPEEYFELRRKAGVIHAMMDLSEKACGFETAVQVRQQPAVRRMLEITVDVIDTLDDVHSLEKDESRGDCHNLVLVLEHAQGWSRSRALAEITGMVCAWCAEFEDRAALLADLGNRAAGETSRLVDCMRDAMSGYLAWSRTVGRPPGDCAAGRAGVPHHRGST